MSIVVSVENHGSRRSFGIEFSKDHGSAPFDRQEMRFDATRFEHFLQAAGVFLDIRRVAGDIGDGKELAQFAQNAVFIRQAVRANFFNDVLCGRQDFFGFDLAADGHLRVNRQAAHEQHCKTSHLNSEIQTIHHFGPRSARSDERHTGKSACATVYFQPLVTTEYFRK